MAGNRSRKPGSDDESEGFDSSVFRQYNQDMATRGLGFTHRQKVKNARFCPWCGVESLFRDDYEREVHNHAANNPQGVDWICLACGVGFRLTNSFRANLALRLLRDERKRRVSNDGMVSPDTP